MKWPFFSRWRPTVAIEQQRRKLQAAQNDVRLPGTVARILTETEC